MKNVAFTFSLVVRRIDSLLVTLFTSLLFFFTLLFVQNGRAVMEAFSFTVLPFTKRLALASSTLVDVHNTFTDGTLILALIGSLIGGINIALAYTYIRLRGEVILHSGLYQGLGLFLAFIGIGCVACGTAFLSVILSFFGLSAVLQVLPYEGQELGYIGLLLLLIATYSLSQKVARSNVC